MGDGVKKKHKQCRRNSPYSVIVPDVTMEWRRLGLHSPARTCSVALSGYD